MRYTPARTRIVVAMGALILIAFVLFNDPPISVRLAGIVLVPLALAYVVICLTLELMAFESAIVVRSVRGRMRFERANSGWSVVAVPGGPLASDTAIHLWKEESKYRSVTVPLVVFKRSDRSQIVASLEDALGHRKPNKPPNRL